MYARIAERSRIAPGAPVAAAVAALFVDENAGDTAGVAIPRPEVHLVARFGPSARGGLDVHAMGVRERVHRKRLRGGQWSVTARLRLGAAEAVLGARAAAIAGRVVPLDDLWGELATRRLVNRMGEARTAVDAAAILERAIGERLTAADRGPAPVILEAARRLTTASVEAVAAELRVSERHLRRLFHDTVGVSPKTFARLARFRRALRAARRSDRASWASIATQVGYYDQAHLITDFRRIAGATPPELLDELASVLAVGC
jgi:AraC-like DNA-binding protein